jgi:hypothetical protein
MGGFVGPVAPSSSGGVMTGLSNLFQNKMFLQFLASAGQDIMTSKPGQLNAAVQQNISSQNYMKLLQQMLSGDIPEGGKIVHSDTGMQITVPRVKQPSALTSPDEMAPSIGTTPESIGAVSSGRGGVSMANSFVTSQQGIRAADLAGVSPEMISQALQFKMMKEELGQKKFNDVMDAMYKGGMLSVAERNAAVNEREVGVNEALVPVKESAAQADLINSYRQLADSMREAPIEVPGIGKLDLKSWDALEPKTKAYAYYVMNSKVTNPSKPVMDYNSFTQQMDPTNLGRLYEQSQKDPAFRKFIFEYARAGAVNLGPAERALESGGVEARVQLMDPAKLRDIVQKNIDNITDVDTLGKIYGGSVDEQSTAKAEIAIKTIEGMITAGKGTIVTKPRWASDGRTIIWTVKWPPIAGEKEGKTEEIRYAVK